MQRRQFIHLSSAGALIGTQQTASAQTAPTKNEPGIPVAMAPRPDGIEIVWRIHGLSKGYVEFGTDKELGRTAGNDGWGLRPAGDESIRVRIDGLKPGTTYHYRTVTESFDRKDPKVTRSELRSFRTLAPTAKTSRFCVWNDTHKHAETLRRLSELTPEADFLLWNGDTCNDWHQPGEVADTLLSPGGGIDHSKGHPLLLVRGNHDLRGTLAYQLEEHAAMPDDQPWFAVRSGPVAALCLDTGEDKPDDHPNLLGRAACEPMRREQASWIKETINRAEFANAPYRIVFCHIPLRWTDETTDYGYDYYSRRSRDLWHEHLVAWGCQMVISGHTHRDAHLTATEAFPYQQLVGGGPKKEQARLITGEADEQRLVVSMADLDGNETRRLELSPLA